MAVHNYGWTLGLTNFEVYLCASSIRYYKAYLSFAGDKNARRVCDVGGFWGVFPVTLKELGYDITMTETLQYYSDAFGDLFKFIADRGVNILDYDPFQPGVPIPGCFDVITVMAVVEHYPHSLKYFIQNIMAMIHPGGTLYIEVPNIAYWPKRLNLLFGRTPLVPLKDIFTSEIPFIGHHHEFTISELRDLVQLAGLSLLSEDYFNYSPNNLPSLKTILRYPTRFLAFLLLKDTQELLAVVCQKT
ncbi:MAG: methyltransferase domain-containing protein [Candidatus Latescibacteria bacterium]|nr:methyltransferase domain-containing protein [Candidatus Latescibacterota bacterium]